MSRSIGRTLSLAIALILAAPTVWAQTTVVDCDQGDDLAAALALAEDGGPRLIEVSGRCEGNFRITTPRTRITGGGPTSTVLATDGRGAVLEIAAPATIVTGLAIEGRPMSGGQGVAVIGESNFLSLSDCRISEFWNALVVQGGRAWISDCEIFDNQSGLTGLDSAELSIATSIVRDNQHGVSVSDGSRLAIENGEIVNNPQGGLAVGSASYGRLVTVRVSDNGLAGILVGDRSRLEVRARSEIDASSEPGAVAATVRGDSTFVTDNGVTVTGDIVGEEFAQFSLHTARVSGAIRLSGFSRAVLEQTEIAGGAECATGSDVACGAGALARTRGCPSAPRSCGSPAPNDRPPADPDQIHPGSLRRDGAARR